MKNMNPIVEKVLNFLTSSSSVNKTSLHINDRDQIISLFRALKELGITFNSNEIKEWLSNSDTWPDVGVINQFSKIIKEINDGIRKKIKNKRFYSIDSSKNLIMRWKNELEKKKKDTP